MKMETFKSSYEWNQIFKIDIIYPDGWDVQNWTYSWFNELISKDEFINRILNSKRKFDKDKMIYMEKWNDETSP